jgi:hypothetical protein
LPTTLGGHAAYGLEIIPGVGYRAGCNDCTEPGPLPGMPLDDEPETLYMVTSSEDLINGCCFDYGNGSLNSANDGNGSAEAVYFGEGVIWGSGNGSGPWVMADLENGLFAGWEEGQDANISTNTALEHAFVTAVLVGDTADKNSGEGRFALYGASAQELEGVPRELTEMYDGIRPVKPGYVPMVKQGSLVLGIGSDNSNLGGGRFYEGAIVRGAASKTTLDAVQAAILAVKYGE